MPRSEPYGVFKVLCVVLPGVLFGGYIGAQVANMLEEEEFDDEEEGKKRK